MVRLGIGIGVTANRCEDSFGDDRYVLKLDCGDVYTTLKIYEKLLNWTLKFVLNYISI